MLPVLLVAALSIALPAQAGDSGHAKSKAKPYALIFGTVFGADDHPAYGVPVRIRGSKGKPYELMSDHSGEFAQRVPAGAGDYVVWAALKDKEAAHKTEVKVHIDNDERQDISLHLPAKSRK